VDTYIPLIPSAFTQHRDVKWVLGDTINGFHPEEKQAIFFYCVLGVTIQEIATVTCLTQNHVASALNLYAERLQSRLHFFKKFVPHDEAESLPASEILFLETLA